MAFWLVDARDRGCGCQVLCDDCWVVIRDSARSIDAVLKEEWGCVKVQWWYEERFHGAYAVIGDGWFLNLTNDGLCQLYRYLRQQRDPTTRKLVERKVEWYFDPRKKKDAVKFDPHNSTSCPR